MAAQTILIDSTFTTDGEIFPFEPNDTIYGLSISGSVSLSSDTSLVRVILTDEAGYEWMVYEAYPLILPGKHCTLLGIADETMYLQVIHPSSIKIQINNGIFVLSSLDLRTQYSENLEFAQMNFKESLETRKVDSMNYFIEDNQMIWFADKNPISEQSFADKSALFGNKYNLCGLDYYVGGVFDPVPGVVGPIDNSTLVDSWDWRSRHGANDPEKGNYYYNQNDEDNGTGWMTDVEYQREIPSCTELCYIYGPLGAIEGFANIYLNQHIDYDLSEQNVLDCDGQHAGDCDGGQQSGTLDYAKIDGVFDESCYPRDDEVNECRNETLPNGPASYRIKISNHLPPGNSTEQLKLALIEKGPLAVRLNQYSNSVDHNMVLVGYKILKAGDKFYKNPDNLEEIIVNKDSPYIGHLVWIYKNSWGDDFGDKGFMINLDEDFHPNQPRYIVSVDDILTPGLESDLIEAYDKDHDGYWNWGIKESFVLPPESCSGLRDSDDSENRLGPFDANYNSIPVKPEMEVSVSTELVQPVPVHNHGFYFFNNDDFTMNVTITNQGSAQLNLSDLNTVTIEQGEVENYTLNIDQLDRKICKENSTSFEIHFDTEKTGETWIATVRINLEPFDFDVYEYFEFQLVYNGCGLVGEDHYVSGYEAWNDYNLVPNDIYIKRSGIMEVFGSLAMFENSDIYIEAGGELIINEGLITNSCRNLWNGIDVWGDASLPQVSNDQGKVTIINGGCIEYAHVAIETAYHPEPGGWRPSGGIISCVDACFRDNETDVRFFPYHNTHPVPPHELLPNFSRFRRTRFETTKGLYLIPGSEPDAHVLLDNVEGLNFQGCTFINSSTHTGRGRGKGIESYTAGYFITSTCREDYIFPCPGKVTCRFEGLDYGIRAFNTNSYTSVTIDSADFINNLRGAHLVLVQHPTIIKNTFGVKDPDGFWSGEDLVGLYLDQNTTGFVVEENDFTGPAPNSSSVGVQLLNTGTDQNEIYNNSFAMLYHGISAVGINRLSDKEIEGVGLCIKCNDFQQCWNDVYVTYETDDQGNPIYTVNTGIAQNQGLLNKIEPYVNTLAAGNTFSDVNTPNYFNNNYCGRIDYTYHGVNNSQKRIEPENNFGDFHPAPDPNASYTKDISCPSHLGGSIIPSIEKNIISSETSLISIVQDTLLMLIDGGNTEGLNYDVLTSFPDEALAVRQELLNESPYLSDTVMISAIEKEDVLPGAMVRDILVQNPQAPKSDKILNALEARQDTIPEYMMSEIMQGVNSYGAKELLEQKLGGHVAKRDMAWKNMNLYYKNDTVNMDGSIDSMASLYQDENRLSSKYELAFLYFYQDDSLSTFGVIENIPTEFNLSQQELASHSRYQDLLEILWSLKKDTTGMDSLQMQSLFDLFNNDQAIPGCYAMNLLIKGRFLDYIEPVYLLDPLKTVPEKELKPQTEKKTGYLKVFPNPAGNYFIASYNTTGEPDLGLLSISDVNGKFLKSYQLKDKQNQIVISTQNLIPGTYLIKISTEKGLLVSVKLIISR